MKRVLLPILSLLFVVSLVNAQTYLSGNLELNDLTPDGSPYILTDDVYITEGHEVAVSPGTEILGMPGVALWVTNGFLYCEGSEDAPIVFSCVNQEEGWGGIRIHENEYIVILDHVILEFAWGHELGAGIYCYESEIQITNSLFRYNNSTHNGGALHIQNSAYFVEHTRFHNNFAQNHGAALSIVNSVGWFDYNILDHNYSYNGGTVLIQGSIDFNFCTFYDNLGNEYCVDFYVRELAHFEARNSIIWKENTNPNIPMVFYEPTGDANAEYCCVYDTSLPGVHLIDEDPLLYCPALGYFHLLPESPCIDAGNPNFPDPDGSPPDLGAIPFTENLPPLGTTIAIPHIAATVGSEIAIPLLHLEPVDDTPVIAMQGHIFIPGELFPEDGFEIIMHEDFVANPDFWDIEWSYHEHLLSFAMAGTEPFQGEGPIFVIAGTLNNNLELGEYPLFLENIILNEGHPLIVPHHGVIHILDYPTGDVSQNYEIQAFDAALILNWLSDHVELEEYQLILADVSADGEVDEFDASLILQYVANLIDGFPASDGMIYPGSAALINRTETIEEAESICIPIILENAENLLSCSIDIELPEGIIVNSINNPNGMGAFITNEDYTKIFLTSDTALSGDDILIAELECSQNLNDDFSITINQIKVNNYFRDLSGYTLTVYLDETSVPGNELPDTYTLLSTYPNPFNPSLIITSELQQAGNLTIRVYDTLGREIQTIVNGIVEGGKHTFMFNAHNLPSGTYYVQASNPQMGKSIKQVVLLK